MTDVAKLQIQVDSTPALTAATNLAALDKAAKRVVEQAKNLKEAKLGKSATTGGAEFKNLTKPVEQAATTIEQYVAKLKTTSGNISGLKSDLATVAGDFGKVVESINKVGDLGKDNRFKTLQEQLKPLGVELRQLVRPLKANAKFFKSIKDNTKGLTKRIGSIATKFADLRQSTAFSARNLRRVNESAEKAAGAFDKLRTGVGQTSGEINRLDGESKQAASSQEKLVRGVNKTGIASLRASNFVRQLATGLGLVSGGFALAQGARNFVTTLSAFEFQAAKTSAVAVKLSSNLKQVAEEQRALIDQARDLGASTRFTAVEAAEAQFFLARAGFDVKEVLDATPATLDLAAAGYLDLGRAADIASNALQQFQLETSQLGDVTDALVFTANNANTSVEQLAQALNYAGPFAASLGVTVNEAAGAIGALGNAGIQGSLAGTNFRGILVSLLSPSREAGEELDKLGKRLKGFGDRRAFDVTTQGIENVVINLREATKSSEDASAEFAKIFNRRNVSGALALSRNIESFSDLLKGLDSDLGTAERVRKFVDDTLVGALQRARSAAAELALALGEGGIGNGLRNFVDDFAKALRVLSGGENAIKNTTERSLKFAAVIKGVTSAIGALITAGAAFAGARFSTLFISALAAGVVRLNVFRQQLNLTNLKLRTTQLEGAKTSAILKTVGSTAKSTALGLTALSITNPAFAFAVAGAAAVAYGSDLFGLFNKSEEAAQGQRDLADATRAAKKELELFVSQEVRVDNLGDRLRRILGLLNTEGGASPQSIITEVGELAKGIEQIGTEAAAGEIDTLAGSFNSLFDTTGKAREGVAALAAELRASGTAGAADLGSRLESAFDETAARLESGETQTIPLSSETFLERLFGQEQTKFKEGFNLAGTGELFEPSVDAYSTLTAQLTSELESQAEEAGIKITEEFQESTLELVQSIVGSGEDQGARIQAALTERDKIVRRRVSALQGTELGNLIGEAVLGASNSIFESLSREDAGPVEKQLAEVARLLPGAEGQADVFEVAVVETGTKAGVAATAFRLLNEEAAKLDLFARVDPAGVAQSFDPLLETLKEVESFLKQDLAANTLSEQEELKTAEALAAVTDLRREQEKLLKEEEAVRLRLSGLQGPALEAEKRRIELLREVAEIEERPLILEFDSENFKKDLSRLGGQVVFDLKADELDVSDLFRIAEDVADAFKKATPQVLTDETERLITERRIREETEKRNAALAEEKKNVDAIVNRLNARKQENENNLDTLRAEVQFQKAIADAKDRQALIDAQVQRETDKLDFSDQFNEQGKLIDNENLIRARELLDPILKDLDLQRQEQRALKLVVETVAETDALSDELVQLKLLKDANSELTAEEEARRNLALANVSVISSGYANNLSVLTANIEQQREFKALLNDNARATTLAELAEENRLLGLRIEQGGKLTSLQEAEAQAISSKLDFTDKELAQLAALIEQNKEYKAALESLKTTQEELKSLRSEEFGDFIRGFQEQTEATLIQAGVTRDLTVEEEALRIARDNNFSSDTLPRIQAEVAARRNATEALQDFNEKVRIAQAEQRALDQAQTNLSRSLADVIVNAKDAEEAFKGFVKQIIAAIAQAKIFALLGKTGLFDKDGLFGAPILEGVNTSVSKVTVEEEFRKAATGEPLSELGGVETKTVQVTELIVNPAPSVVERKVIETRVGPDGSPISFDQTPLEFEADPGSLKASVEGLSLPVEFEADPGSLSLPPVPVDLEVDPTNFEQLGGALDGVDFGVPTDIIIGNPEDAFNELERLAPAIVAPISAELDPELASQLGAGLDTSDLFGEIRVDTASASADLDAFISDSSAQLDSLSGDLGLIPQVNEVPLSLPVEFQTDPGGIQAQIDNLGLEVPVKPVGEALDLGFPEEIDVLSDKDRNRVFQARRAINEAGLPDLEVPEVELPVTPVVPSLDRDEYLNNIFEKSGGAFGKPLELDVPEVDLPEVDLPVAPIPSLGALEAIELPEVDLPVEAVPSLEALEAIELPAVSLPVDPAADALSGEASSAAALTTASSTAAATLTTGATTVATTISSGATAAGGALTTAAGTAASGLTGGGGGAAAAMIQGATAAAAILSKASAASAATGAAGGAAGGGAGFLSSFLGLFGIPTTSYKGNVFTDGTMDRQYYSGGVPFLDQLPKVGSQPASFLGQDGSLNSLREGGSQEAILPLGRDGQGRLGVRMVGGSSGSTANVTNNNSTTVQNFNLQAPTDTFGMTSRQKERKMARFSRRG
tara:strand:+ start:6394 stop:13155 length:6762 start_codon:yes stop_codon:yes gene_type:complete